MYIHMYIHIYIYIYTFKIIHTVKVDAKQNAALRDFGGGIVTDGWDGTNKKHYINFMIVTHQGATFENAIDVTDNKSDNAKYIFDLMDAVIKEKGPLNILLICTDTPHVMKAAWKLVEDKYGWISCVGCMTHVLNLLFKDIAGQVGIYIYIMYFI